MDQIAMDEMMMDTIWGIDTTVGPKCEHCGKECSPVELNRETLDQVDMCGVESLMEVDQAVYEGVNLCEECYYKEMGL